MKKKKKLNTITEDTLKVDLEAQKDLNWDFYKEREFSENLFNQRFNYFLITFALIVTASATVKTIEGLIITLSLGFILTFLIWLTIYRIYIKLMVLLTIMHMIPNESQVFRVIDKELETYGFMRKLFGVNPITGWILPLFCILILLIGLILVFTGCLEPLNC